MSIQLKIFAKERINLTLLQNHIPLIQSIEILNDSEVPVEDLKLKIKSDPEGMLTSEVSISNISSAETFVLENPKVSHSWDFFKNLSEKISGSLVLEIEDRNGNLLTKAYQDIYIEPENVWLGQQAPLEILVSHIMPNSETIQSINRKAADILKNTSGNSALDGYQAKNRERVYQIAQAIYQAIREENITYSEPPASFEESGQKIRTPHQILKHCMATCLDIALLYAGCLEQAGIHPLIFIIKGHAFTGFWLEDKFLPRHLEEDPQFFRKRIELDELAALDITGATSDNNPGFSYLEECGKKYFDSEENFICGIDVTHCRRLARIHPINDSNTTSDNTSALKRELRKEERNVENREFKNFEIPEESKAQEKELDKWKDKLLDLSFRNRLLNFRPNKGTVEILCHSPSEIEDIITDGSVFEILPQIKQSSLNFHRTDQKEILADQISANFERKKLLTKIPEEKFHSLLNSLYRSVVNAEEETGANTLYLALGILSWKETESSSQIRRSPILLLPVNLIKKSVGGKFSLSLRDDDTVLNHTLLQKIKRDYDMDIPGLDPLPEDESGVDVPLIFDIIRKVIRDKRGWEVKEEVWLSEFSFQKYLMWKELTKNYEDMLKSPLIRRIMTSEVPDKTPDFISEEQVEKLLHPKDIYCPLSADSSQMAAVLSAANGNSFVLQGPPGTGKSQTIANMIAHCIGIGKRILFVSEKKVALEVVYRRLQEIGIGPFCLELHSKKSEKKEVVKSFYNALEFSSEHLNGEWYQVADELKASRDGLNQYFENLHESSASGISAYKAFGVASRNQDLPNINLKFQSFLDFPEADLREIRAKLKTWKEFADALSTEEFLAWASVSIKQWNYQTEDWTVEQLKQVQIHVSKLEQNSNTLSKLPQNNEWKIPAWYSFEEFLNKLLETPDITSDFLNQNDFAKYQKEISDHLGHLKRQAELKIMSDEVFLPQVYNENFYQFKQQLQETREGFFPITFIKKFQFKGNLKKLLKNKIKPLEDYESYFEAGIEYQEGLAKEEIGLKAVKEFKGEDYQLQHHNSFKDALVWTCEIHRLLISLYSSDFEVVSSVKTFISNILENRTLALADSSNLKLELEQKQELLKILREKLYSLGDKLELKNNFFEITPVELKNKLRALENTSSLFRDITNINVLKSELIERGLESLFNKVDEGEISKSNIEAVFDFNFHRLWLQEKNSSSEILNNTTGLQLNNLDSHYKKTDQKYRVFTEKALSGKISADKPKMGNLILPETPVGLIVKENKKSRKHLPIRKFLDSISSVSKGLKPCYLMSPMSVSQYLPVSPDFDIVIFDEASQIPPWDAIGALSRGKQAIIVGDTKQLPPTAFFSMQSEDDSDEKIDCESILEMFGSIYPEMLLKWHYRSRSESLISFSNYHIYDNRLHTFPSSHTDDNKVSLEIVKGKNSYYDRGKSKTNAGEANAVVNEIFNRLKSTECSDSVGVVTFSSVQANLISDLIDERLQKEPKFENFFDVTNPEYIFVKNLENVQGDERDVILFSVGYGKDIHGRISRNFGPLNNSGGERRLNVAVTRARNEVKVFSNFHPRELDVTTSGSEGLRLLKEYLLYAQDGHSSLLRQQVSNDIDEFDSIFEKEVAVELRKRGWNLRTQIGVGGYRVDLGVIHPEFEGQFLAGIECDGARYHSAKSARDRDILRQMVLEGLGWKILRIWSTDWWYDSKKCIDQLHHNLEELLITREKVINEISKNTGLTEKNDQHDNLDNSDIKENPEETIISKYDPTVINLSSQGDFFENRALVRRQVEEIVKTLSPISQEECFSMIARSWGFTRRGNRIDNYLKTCANDIHRTNGNGQEFLWNSPEQIKSISELRLPVDGEKRHPTSVAPEELMYGFLPILQSNIEVPKDVLFKEIAKMLGFTRISKENMKYMNPAMDLIKNQQLVIEKENIIFWKG